MGRRALALLLVLAPMLIGLASSCKTPTQIVVEVRSNACPSVQGTNVTVAATEAEIDAKREPNAAKSGCDSAQSIGTLVLVPENDGTSDVVLRIVAGVTRRPDDCAAANNAGCIVAKRRTRFAANEVVRVVVDLNTICLDKVCGSGTTCDETSGACVGIPCTGTECLPPVGSDATTDGPQPPIDGGPDAPPTDAKSDAKATCEEVCTGLGRVCNNGTCIVTCPLAANCKQNPGDMPCPPGVPCQIECTTVGACNSLSCGGASSCVINCSAVGACNATTTCGTTAKSCRVNCTAYHACEDVKCLQNKGTDCRVSCNGATEACNGTVTCCENNTTLKKCVDQIETCP